MKKIVRLTENDLVRLVKRVLDEQAMPLYTNQGGNVWNTLKKAIEGAGTDESLVKRACGMVTTPEIYKQVLALANKEGHKTVMDYIMTDFSIPYFDTPQSTSRRYNVNKSQWDDEGYGKDVDTQTTKFCANNLSKFNRNEMAPFNKKITTDRPV